MTSYCEFISIYHPDRLCDYITSCLLDHCIVRDKYVEYRVECVFANKTLFLVGTIGINSNLLNQEVVELVKQVLKQLQLSYNVVEHIDINVKKTTPRVLTDKGLYYGFATAQETGLPYFYNQIYTFAYAYITPLCRQAFYKLSAYKDNKISCEITLLSHNATNALAQQVTALLQALFKDELVEVHFKIKDSLEGTVGMTGRKLCFDYYYGLIPNNGGSPWGKDPYNADLTLNLLARWFAVDIVQRQKLESVTCTVQVLDSSTLQLSFFQNEQCLHQQLYEFASFENIIHKLALDHPVYKNICQKGLIFSII